MAPHVVEQVIETASKERFSTVALGGGEPLSTLPQTIHAIETATKSKLLTAVTTSGHGLNAAVISSLERAGLNHLQLSLGDNRVNITAAYNLMVSTPRSCSFGVNFLMSPQLIRIMPLFLRKFDADKIDQVTLLLPKGTFGNTHRFSSDEFMRYYSTLNTIKLKHTVILVDCATQQILQGHCAAQGCSVFPDSTVSRCAFGCGKRVPLNGSLTEAMANDKDECREGLTIMKTTRNETR
jgi:hypothetical protein